MSCNNFNFPGCCDNPCAITQENTAACESLPSQLENFITQFFGEVIKTEVNGIVTWSLPCELNTGLPNNPRAAGEGLGCYLLRLIQNGVDGRTGPPGKSGPSIVVPAPTIVNAFYIGSGTNYEVQDTYQAVDFLGSAPRVLLPVAGKYLITAIVDGVGLPSIGLTDGVAFKLVETTTATDVPGSEHVVTTIAVNQKSQVVINVIFEATADNMEVGVYGLATALDVFSVLAANTTLSLVRIA